MKSKFSLSDWLWVGYPIVVVVLMAVVVNMFATTSQQRVEQMSRQQNNVETQEEKIARLKTKLSVLRQVNMTAGSADLELGLTAIPENRKMWLVMNEARFAAASSEASISRYTGQTADDVRLGPGSDSGDIGVISVTYEIDEFDQIREIIENLEKLMPLVKVRRISFDTDKMEIDIEGARSVWGKVEQDVDAAIPAYTSSVSLMKNKLQGLEQVTMEPIKEPVRVQAPVNASGSATTQ